jgi:hypothetical protein
MKFGPVFIPGISGSAPFIVALILFLKGYKVRGAMSTRLHPGNSISGNKRQIYLKSAIFCFDIGYFIHILFQFSTACHCTKEMV